MTPHESGMTCRPAQITCTLPEPTATNEATACRFVQISCTKKSAGLHRRRDHVNGCTDDLH